MTPRPRTARTRPSRCRGQAIAEYTVVLMLTTLVLVVAAAEPAVIDEILDAVKSFFKAFSYALSIPAQHGI
ncbi:hypothetical protein [Roseateles sp.]|jgi:Flp pilus assembly pilin Flp|uniref:hypothetical protein n=1 Tax=Roseateles sp. TaxID=1971397 RepID=UPI003BA941F3